MARNGDDTLRLDTQATCQSDTIAAFESDVPREDLHAGAARVDGKDYAVCWHEYGAFAHVRYEDGDHGMIPLRDFKADLSGV